jgi:hypothetical protein
MSKKISGVVALAGMCALSLFLLNCGSSSSRPSGVLYVLTQGSNGIGNNVSSFALDLNSGNLSLVNSNASTCPTAASQTAPEPCGLPLDILLDPTGANAFVLNQGIPCVEVLQNGIWVCEPGSNTPILPTIYSYTVNSDGSLSKPGTPVTWTCANVNVSSCTDAAITMARDAAGQFLFVIDQGSSPSPGFPTPSQTNPSCPHAPSRATDVCPSISVFTMKAGSTSLTLASGSPFYLSKIPTALSAITFTQPGSSAAQELLFVTNNEDICTQGCSLQHNDNTVSVYAVGSDGTLTEQPNSPYAVAAVNPISVLAVNTNPAGQSTAGGVFVYVGNQGATTGAVNPFELCTVQNAVCSSQQVAQNLMLPVTTCTTSCIVSAGQKPIQMLADPTNNFLYVLSEGSNQLFGFKINTTAGTLTPLSPANQPTGLEPVSMAVHPSVNNTGQFLYTSNSGSSNISGFSLDTVSGSIFNPIAVVSPAAPSGMAVH